MRAQCQARAREEGVVFSSPTAENTVYDGNVIGTGPKGIILLHGSETRPHLGREKSSSWIPSLVGIPSKVILPPGATYFSATWRKKLNEREGQEGMNASRQ